MTEWAVVGVIVVLVGLVASVVTPMLRLNTTIVKLTVQLEHLDKLFKDALDQNARAHERIWSKTDEQDKRLDDHERRIVHLEDMEELGK